ncbi:hypothetical protein C0992_004690 [Termitomyces sp. T32_za158]|nr:hypothetical protein C0992_004690 [Termitomyces sp. T32_za158]
MTGHGKLDKGKAPVAPSVGDERVDSSKEPSNGHKGSRKVWGQEPELDSSDEEEDTRSDSTEYIKLFTWIYELELNEYIKHKLACGTATSTATPAESVEYDALLCHRELNIVEAMDMLNAPQQANESQQDYERQQNAA